MTLHSAIEGGGLSRGPRIPCYGGPSLRRESRLLSLLYLPVAKYLDNKMCSRNSAWGGGNGRFKRFRIQQRNILALVTLLTSHSSRCLLVVLLPHGSLPSPHPVPVTCCSWISTFCPAHLGRGPCLEWTDWIPAIVVRTMHTINRHSWECLDII